MPVKNNLEVSNVNTVLQIVNANNKNFNIFDDYFLVQNLISITSHVLMGIDSSSMLNVKISYEL